MHNCPQCGQFQGVPAFAEVTSKIGPSRKCDIREAQSLRKQALFMTSYWKRRENPMTEKERLQLRLQPETREKIERWQSAAGCRSMNEFVEKAVNFYADYLASDDSGVLLSPAIQSAIDGQLQEFKEQVKSLLFKQAVEMDMGISVLADCVNLDEAYLRKKRAESVASVKKFNGRLRLEQIVKRAQERRDGDDGWQD